MASHIAPTDSKGRYPSSGGYSENDGNYGAGVIVFSSDLSQTVLIFNCVTGLHSFPKGKLKKGESLTDGALRELFEETGIKKNQIQFLDKWIVEKCKNYPVCTYAVASLLPDVKMNPVMKGDRCETAIWYSLGDAQKLGDAFAKRRLRILNNAIELTKTLKFTPKPPAEEPVKKPFNLMEQIYGVRLVLLTEPEVCVHGVTTKTWEQIKDKGIDSKGSNRKYFKLSVPSQMLVDKRIYIDMSSAMKDGIVFYKSGTAIWTSGINGVLSSKYFKK